MTPTFLALALLACEPGEGRLDPPIGDFIEDAYEVQAYEAAPDVGNAPLFPVVRAVNQYGGAIPSEPHGVLVNGVSQTVAFDALGYGRVRLDVPGLTSVDDGTTVVEATVLDSNWQGFGISRAFEAVASEASQAVGISTGSVIALGRELWYVGPDSPPHRVLNADGAIVGMEAGNINVDGVLDLVAWTETTVFLMRGRLNGGLAYGAALTADRFRVGGASIGELDDDNLPDLAIAWAAQDGTSKLDIWHGNGLFGFKAAEPRNLPAIPISVSIGDNTGEGTNQITVLSEDGSWARFIIGSPDRYMPIGPNKPDAINIPLGSTVQAWGDINGDDGDELWFLGPLNPDSVRNIMVVDLVGNKIEFLPLNPMAAWVARDDLDGNGLVDHIELQSSRALRSLSFDETSSNSYTPRAVTDLPAYGPMVVGDIVDDDGVPDLFVAGEDLWWWWRGDNNPDSSEVFWNIGEQAMVEAGETIGPILVSDYDGNPNTTEILGFESVNGGTWFTAWSWDPATQSASVLGSTELTAGSIDPLDIAHCGGRVWVLLEGSIARVNVTDPSAPSVTNQVNSQATAIDCGVTPDAGGELARLTGGTVEITDPSFNILSTLQTPGAEDVALGDRGNGPEVFTCNTPGCSVAYWPDGDLSGAFAKATDSQTTIEGSGSLVVPGYGALSVYDVDGNGLTDLVAAGPDGMITVHRATPDGPGMAEFFHTRSVPVGPVAVTDADGDGRPDLWLRDELDRLLYSVAPRTGPADPGTTNTTP